MAYEQDDLGQVVRALGLTTTFSPQITICMWILADSQGVETETQARMLNKGSSYHFRLNGATSRLRFHRNFTGVGSVNGQWRTSDGTIVFGTLYHVAVTYDDSDLANDAVFYIDGVVSATTEIAAPVGTPDSAGGNTRIANTNIGATRTFDGLLDDVRIYDRVLSAAEIRTIFQTRGVDGIVEGLQLRYTFMERPVPSPATGTDTVKDVSPEGNDGTPGKESDLVSGIDSFTVATSTIVLDAVEGNQTAFFTPGRVFTVSGATNPGNNGSYTVVSSSFAVATSIITTVAPAVDEAASPAVSTIVFADPEYADSVIRTRRRVA